MSQESANLKISDADYQRILWTLKSGPTPLSRIFSTLKHLNSQISQNFLQQSLEIMVSEGKLQKQSHPFDKKKSFYSLPSSEKENHL